MSTYGVRWPKAGSGGVSGPGTSTIGHLAAFADTGGEELSDAGAALSTDGTFAANSDAKVPTEKAVKTYAQPKDATLTQLSALDGTVGFLKITGLDTFARVPSGVAAATDLLTRGDGDGRYQALEATLTALAAIVGTAGVVEQTSADVFTIRLIGTANATDLLTRAGGDARYQALEATLTALAGIATTAGVIEQTSADTFTIRLIGTANASDLLTRAGGDGRYVTGIASSVDGDIMLFDGTGGKLAKDSGIKIVTAAGGSLSSSDTDAPTEKRVKDYIDAQVATVNLSTGIVFGARQMFVWSPRTSVTSSIDSWGLLAPAPAGDSLSANDPNLSNGYVQNLPFFQARSNANGSNLAGINFSSHSAAFSRGGSAGLGGFDIYLRFGVFHDSSGKRLFVGLAGNTLGNGQPSAFIDIIGVGTDTGDTNLQFMHNDGSESATKIDTGAALTNNILYELHISCASNSSAYTITLSSVLGSGKTVLATSSPSTNITAATTMQAPALLCNAAGATGNARITLQQQAGTWQ